MQFPSLAIPYPTPIVWKYCPKKYFCAGGGGGAEGGEREGERGVGGRERKRERELELENFILQGL